MQKQQVLYIHGGESFLEHNDFLERLKTAELWHLPTDNEIAHPKKWSSTLGEDLGEGYEVIMPPMPNKQNAQFAEWKIWFERHFEYLAGEPILIGHSLGAMFLAKYFSLYELPFTPKAVLLLAGAYQLSDFSDKDCGDFLVEPEKVRNILNKVGKVLIMHSKDDFVVPFVHGETLAKSLPEAEFLTFTDHNHFLIEEFPELISKIRGFGG